MLILQLKFEDHIEVVLDGLTNEYDAFITSSVSHSYTIAEIESSSANFHNPKAYLTTPSILMPVLLLYL